MTCFNKFPVDLNQPKIQIDLSEYEAELLQDTTIRLYSVKSTSRDVLIKSSLKPGTKKNAAEHSLSSSAETSAARALSSSAAGPSVPITAATDSGLPPRGSIEEGSTNRVRNGSTTSDASHSSNIQVPVLPGVFDGTEMTIQEWFQLIKDHIDYATINRSSFGKPPPTGSSRDCLRV